MNQITYRDLHEDAAGYRISDEFFTRSGINPAAVVVCNCKWDGGHQAICDIVAAHALLLKRRADTLTATEVEYIGQQMLRPPGWALNECSVCGSGWMLPSGVCDHCDQPALMTPAQKDAQWVKATEMAEAWCQSKDPYERDRAIYCYRAGYLKALRGN